MSEHPCLALCVAEFVEECPRPANASPRRLPVSAKISCAD